MDGGSRGVEGFGAGEDGALHDRSIDDDGEGGGEPRRCVGMVPCSELAKVLDEVALVGGDDRAVGVVDLAGLGE